LLPAIKVASLSQRERVVRSTTGGDDLNKVIGSLRSSPIPVGRVDLPATAFFYPLPTEET